MKLSFKKISAVTSSLLMAGMSIAIPVAAANYPAPFISGNTADVAIVYGTGTGVSSMDFVQAGNIQTDLQSRLSSSSSSSSSTTTTVSGEAYPLFTSSSKIYMNQTLNSVRTTLTKTELPTVLADGTFEGDVNADYTQMIRVGSYPRLVFANQPTSDDDPIPGFALSTSTSNPVYNLTITFDQAVNFTDSDSIGESLTLFGRQYTIGAGTTTSKLYLYESSETIALSIGGSDPSSTTVTVGNETYTIELISASDTDATIKVTDSSGDSQTKTISEDSSKRVQGVDIAVDLADETTNYGLKAQITVGANKVLLQSGSKVKTGSDEESVDGTLVGRSGSGWDQCTGFSIAVTADDTDVDAITEGGVFTDPVFGTIKVDFANLANDDDRETITVKPSGSDKATLEMTTHTGDTKSINWYYNDSATARLADSGDNGNDEIHVVEGDIVNVTQYVVVGNEDEGYLLELYELDNNSDDTNDDIVFRDAFNTDNTYKVTGITSEGQGELIVGGRTYTVHYHDESAEGADYVTLDYPDSSSGYKVVYPTIETSKGAKVAFYEPETLSAVGLTHLRFPDGDGYTDVAFAPTGGAGGNVTVSGTVLSSGESTTVSVGPLTYNFTYSSANHTTVHLLDESGNNINLPGLVIFEEEDDQNTINALIVKMEGAGTSDSSVGVSEVETTWNDNGANTDWNELQEEATDEDLYDTMDYWGTKIVTDKSDSDQYSAEISYPDEQVNAEVYIGEVSSSVTSSSGSSGGSTLSGILVKDTEIDSVKDKNLIIVGGSCINSAAAHVLGGNYCGAAFTAKTGVGPGQFLIQGIADAYTPGKLALLVAGYEAADTVNAATYVQTQTFDTSKKYIGTSSTSAELVTEESA